MTDRARADERDEEKQLVLLDSFVQQTITNSGYDEDLSTMLFELLLPNDLKDQMRDEIPLVFVVDETSSGYPWELLAQRSRKQVTPLSVSFGMLRQFSTKTFRNDPRSTRQLTAFVVGDPEISGSGFAGFLSRERRPCWH